MKLSASMLRVLREVASGRVTYAFGGDYRDATGAFVSRQIWALRKRGMMLPFGYGPDVLTDAGRAALEENA